MNTLDALIVSLQEKVEIYLNEKIDIAVAAERERCAKLLDEQHERSKDFHNYGAYYARLIREQK